MTENRQEVLTRVGLAETCETETDVLERAVAATGAASREFRSCRPTIQKLSVLVPVYNERWTLRDIIGRVLNCPTNLELELVIVDDCSTDGSWDVLQEIARADSTIRVFRHVRNLGKGAAVRTAIKHMTGDVAVIQDADLEYDPRDYPNLLRPIIQGKADAVFGSRFAGHERRVLFFWHHLANRFLTLLSNIFNDLNLTDMETCYKMVRTDVLKRLRLKSNTFTFEPELTCRLAQWGARIYEVPISYSGRSYQEGKKIKPIDGLKAIAQMVYSRFLDTRFTDHSGLYILKSVSRSTRYHTWTIRQCRDYVGDRILEAGSGIGNLSALLLDHERVVLVDCNEEYVARLLDRFGERRNVRIVHADLTTPSHFDLWKDEKLDTIFCSNVLEHLDCDDQVLRGFHDALAPGGTCVIVVPQGPWLFGAIDEELGHFRRYTIPGLRKIMQEAGFEIVFVQSFSKLGALAWWVSGKILRNRHLSPRKMVWFDRLWPIAKCLDYLLPIPGMSLIMVGRRIAP